MLACHDSEVWPPLTSVWDGYFANLMFFRSFTLKDVPEPRVDVGTTRIPAVWCSEARAKAYCKRELRQTATRSTHVSSSDHLFHQNASNCLALRTVQHHLGSRDCCPIISQTVGQPNELPGFRQKSPLLSTHLRLDLHVEIQHHAQNSLNLAKLSSWKLGRGPVSRHRLGRLSIETPTPGQLAR